MSSVRSKLADHVRVHVVLSSPEGAVLVTSTGTNVFPPSSIVEKLNSYLSPEHLVLPPLLPCCSLDYLGWQLQNQHFLFYIFSLSTHVSPVSRTASTTIFRFLALFRPPSALPDPILVPVPSIVVPVPIPATALASVPVPVPVPIRYSSTVSHPRPRPRSRPVLLRSPPPQFPFPLRPRPHDRSRPRYRLRSHPRLQSRPRPRSLLSVPRPGYPPGTMCL